MLKSLAPGDVMLVSKWRHKPSNQRLPSEAASLRGTPNCGAQRALAGLSSGLT